jgi:chromosomal replication initiator protein
MYVGRRMTDYSYTEIGQDFGGRDHSTVLHSINKIEDKLITDSTLESTIESLKRSVKEFSAKY